MSFHRTVLFYSWLNNEMIKFWESRKRLICFGLRFETIVISWSSLCFTLCREWHFTVKEDIRTYKRGFLQPWWFCHSIYVLSDTPIHIQTPTAAKQALAVRLLLTIIFSLCTFMSYAQCYWFIANCKVMNSLQKSCDTSHGRSSL